MKKILNYGISWKEKNENTLTLHSMEMFSKQTLIYEYLRILNRDNPDIPTNISSLTCFVWEGIKDPAYRDITGEINRFLH